MKIEDWLKSSVKRLDASGIGSARLDCLILLEDALGADRSRLLAHQEIELSASQLKTLNKQIERRAKDEPLAYIRGFCEFYGRKFLVNRHVLEPRPESETMVKLLLDLAKSKKQNVKSWRIADVGSGSGCLGITAALELQNHNVDLHDIDANTLAVAKNNMALHELHLKATKRDLLRNSHTAYDVILANLPYLPSHWNIHSSIKMEPKIAFLGGKDGLDVYRRLFEQLSHFSWRPAYVLTESMPPQHKELAQSASSHGFKQLSEQDFIQLFAPAANY